MILKYNVEDKLVKVSLEGELDTPATLEIQEDINKVLEHADSLVSIDCSKLSYLASSGLRQIIAIYKKCSAEGGHMELVGVNPDVLEIFKVTNFDKVFDIK